MHGCLGDDTIAAMLEGGLPDEQARAARVHLGDCDECRRLVAGALDGSDAAAATLPALPSLGAPRVESGATVDGIRVLRLLGEGGMGRVFEAAQPGLDRRVALKILRPELARDRSALVRFQREARLVAALASEHVVRVHGYGVAPSGEPYLVMELLDGEDLATILERGRVSVEQAVAWVCDACDALGEAHRLGIVHRDLKPSNLFVTRSGRLVVLDFGLAKLAGTSGATTADGTLLGSPHYMAPEQITGARDVDARADVWSLGATLYHLVTGDAPFRAPTLDGVFSRILDGAPPDLSRVPGWLAPVIARALARDPVMRHASARELAAALRGQPVRAGIEQRYELVEQIGEGAHGTVYRARPRHGGREVALKVLRNISSRARFEREASIVQRLEHPNTVRLVDAGVADDGTPFMAFELMLGRHGLEASRGRTLSPPVRTLAAELARGPLLPARVVRIAVQALKALGEAHALGIVHRDVTPSNILLIDFVGDPDFVKLLDFGVAAEVDAPKLTMTGHLVGTPRYMAPEQVTGGRVDARTDLYALGLVLAEALTAAPVFQSASAIAACFHHASAEPVPLPRAVVDGPLGDVIVKATQKRPEDRFGSAAEMLAMVERGPVAAARPALRPEREVRAERKRFAPGVALGAGCAIVLGAIGLAAWQPWKQPPPAAPASPLQHAVVAATSSLDAGAHAPVVVDAVPEAAPIESAPTRTATPPKPDTSDRPTPAPSGGALLNVDDARLRRRAEALGWTVRETNRESFPSCEHTRIQLTRGALEKQTYRWADLTLFDCVSPEVAASEVARLRRGFGRSWFVVDGHRMLMVSTDDPDAPGEGGSKKLAELVLAP